MFEVKIHELKRKELPELDDEFAKDVDEEVETLAELKEKHEEIIEMVSVDAKDLLFTNRDNKSVRSYMEREFELEEMYPF